MYNIGLNWMCGKDAAYLLARVGDNKLKVILVGILVFAVGAMRITRYFGLEKWQVYVYV